MSQRGLDFLRVGLGLVATAVAFAAAALAAAWLALPPVPPGSRVQLDAGPRSGALRRCRSEGEGALADPACAAAWRGARSAFLAASPEAGRTSTATHGGASRIP